MKKVFLFMIAITLLQISCKKEAPTAQEASINTKANITGKVKLFDEWGNSVSQEKMLVSLENGIEDYWAETEKDGSFLLQNVLYHKNYSVVYKKDGFGTYKSYGFNHEYTGAEGRIPATPSLSMISTTYVTSLDAEANDSTVIFNVHISSTSKVKGTRRIRFLFHSISGISNEVFSNYSNKIQLVNSSATITFTKDDLQTMGLESGTKYWVQAYGDSYFSNAYDDDLVGRYVFPNLGFKSDVAVPTEHFIMP